MKRPNPHATPLILADSRYFIKEQGGAGRSLQRWTIATLIALLVLLFFLLFLIKSERTIIPREPPVLTLDYIILEPQRQKEQPKPKRKPRPVKKKPRPKVEKPKPFIHPTNAVTPKEPVIEEPESIDTTPKAEPLKPTPPEIVRITSTKELDNLNFEPIHNPQPAYPLIALKAEIEGYVEVDLLVNQEGRVEKFSIVKVIGHQSFANATAKVIPRWRYPPPRIKGKKIKIKYRIPLEFKLD